MDDKKKDSSITYQEVGEFSEKLRSMGKKAFEDIKPAIEEIEEEQTRRNLEGQTVRIGKSQISTIVEEFWQYYSQFSSLNLPKRDEYLSSENMELKIMVLLNLLQEFYKERIYPPSSRFPIVHFRYFGGKTKENKKGKIFLVADTHGSFKDTVKMVKLFTMEIEKAKTTNLDVKVVFIGDFVDRNELDIHNILYIITFNLKYPNNVILLRGNHEEVTINANYGFGKNVMDKFSKILFAQFNNIFKDLPLLVYFHTMEGNILCLHGGIPIISENNGEKFSIPDLNAWEFKNRSIYIDDMDTVSQQLLWNDPMMDEGNNIKFLPNRRGLGYIFGKEVFDEFIKKNNVQLVFRGHQVFPEGIRKFFDGSFVSFFSATEYSKNIIRARIIEIDSENIYNYKVLEIQKDLPG